MTGHNNSPRSAALQELEAALEQHRRERPDAGERIRRLGSGLGRIWPGGRPGWRPSFNPGFMFSRRHPVMRGIAIALAVLVVIVGLAGSALWWRLASGPIMLDIATPLLTSAIEEKLGDRYRVEVGGTQLERDAQGHTAVRLRDIRVRDASGTLVAAAPKAEVGIAGTSLLTARPRAESVRLVDANVVLRVDPDGRINVMVGGEQPFATIAPGAAPAPAPAARSAPTGKPTPGATTKPAHLSLQTLADRGLASNLAMLVAWIDGLGGIDARAASVSGFDGHELAEIGITNGSLSIDDRRNGREWKFQQITLSLIRPKQGGAALSILSESKERPWMFQAALVPRRQGNRHLQIEARKIVLDDLLALRMSDMRVRSDTLVSASVDSEIAPDGMPQTLTGTIVAQGGSIGDLDDPAHRIPIGSAEFGLDWDVGRGTLRVPFKVDAGAARFTLRSEFAAPTQPDGPWTFGMGGGWIVIDPPTSDEEGLVLKRVALRGSIDLVKQRITIEQGDLGSKELGSRDEKDVSIAVSGNFDYGGEPKLALGLAGNRISAGAFKRLWPVFVAPKVRDWVDQHIVSGNVDRVDIATNATIPQMQAGGPPMPEEGLAVQIMGSAATLRPVAGLPAIRDADINVRVTGRTATVLLGKGVIDVSPGRRLTISNGVFEVPDTRPKAPNARVRFKVDGPAPAAAELLALDRLREFSGAPFDPVSTRGTMSAQVQLGMVLRPDLPKGSTNYSIAVDLTNFSAEKMLAGQKVEAQLLRVTANNQRYEIKGDVKVAGTPAQLEYRKSAGDTDAEVKLVATLDDAARTRLGLDLAPMLTGSLPMKVSGRVAANDEDSRFSVETDLTSAKIEQLLPGWVKPAGRPARVSFNAIRDKGAMRFDDLLVDGPGVLAKGSIELDGNGDLQSANFPVFATSDGDKATVKADRGPDGALRVTMRGDVYDGRNFIKAAMSSPTEPKAKASHPDLDLDIKLGVVAGHHGEALRGLDLRISRRGGRIRAFNLNAKIGRDTQLLGDMRTRVSNSRPVIYIETNDAGALFRFTDVYPRINGGKMWIGMDPPSQDSTPQEGVINVRDFTVQGEATLDRALSGGPNGAQRSNNNIDFSQARAEFTRTPGRLAIRDGVIRGPVIGATMEGNIDYGRDEVHVRGTLVPLYGLNNMFGQIPIVGLFLGGGSNEGIFGITYEVTGSTSAPRPVVNPISAIAPGMLRKFFEFRDTPADRDRAFIVQSR